MSWTVGQEKMMKIWRDSSAKPILTNVGTMTAHYVLFFVRTRVCKRIFVEFEFEVIFSIFLKEKMRHFCFPHGIQFYFCEKMKLFYRRNPNWFRVVVIMVRMAASSCNFHFIYSDGSSIGKRVALIVVWKQKRIP